MTAWILSTFPGPAIALFFMGGSVAFCCAVTVVGRRFVARPVRHGHNEVGGMILATVGVIYAVLLAFTVIALWERRSAVEAHADDEATALVAAYRDVGGLPEPIRTRIRSDITAYLTTVVEQGYPALRKGVVALEGRAAFAGLFSALQGFEPKGAVQQTWYDVTVAELNRASNERAHRVVATSGSLPDVFWHVLFVATAITLGLGALISMDDARHHFVFMGLFGACTGALLFLATVLDRPFAGDYGLTPETFRAALEGIHLINR